MNADDFRTGSTGRLVPTIHGCLAFVPHPLPPPNLDMGRLAVPLERAVRVLGELSGIGHTLPNPDLLIRPFSRVEAVASSKIEGTVTPVSELLMLERSPDISRVHSDTREVHNYNRALHAGLRRLPDLPLSKRLLCELHVILLEGVAPERGARIVPGELKRDQNWIGSRTIQNARYVPAPPGEETLNALDSLERFIHTDGELPLLVKLALVHYQFEAIHPFPDGNGRLGRLIIPLLLCEQRAMSQPLLYLSAYFEKHYDRYIDAMYDISSRGAWDAWLDFFLTGVETAANNAITKARALQELHQKYIGVIQAARSSALLAKIVDALFDVPAITVPYTESHLGVTYNAAKNNINKLVELGIIRPDAASGRPQWFYAHEIMQITAAQDA